MTDTAYLTDATVQPGRWRRFWQQYANMFSVARASLFWVLLRRQRRTMGWLLAITVIYSFGLYQIANLTRNMVDNAIVDQVAPLWGYVRYIAFWALWGLVFGFILQQLAERLTYAIEFDLRMWLYTHIQSGDLRRLDTVATGQLLTRSLTDVELIVTLLRVLPTLTGFVPVLVAISVIVIIINPIMGVMAILALPINAWLIGRFRARLRALSWAELNERAEVTSAIDEPVRGIRVVKAFGREETERAKVAHVTERAFRYSMTRTRLLARYDLLMKITPMLVQASVLALGAYMLSTDRLSAGTFLLAFQLTNGLNAFASTFDLFASAWQYLRGAQDRVAEMLAFSSRPVTDGRMVPSPSSGLELHGISVTYGDRCLLGGFDVTVRSGELVVVHGAPGSGKSTLASIGAGLTAPTTGVAILDGTPHADLDPTQLRRAIRVVAEEPLLLATSLRDNLLLGAFGDVTDAMLTEAVQAAAVEEIIDELGGFDGVLGDRGLTVSGGQRQRISLARALIARPRVLILDDALSAVNPSLETEIMRRVRSYLPDTGILYITRRDGLTALADRSITLPPPILFGSTSGAPAGLGVDEQVTAVGSGEEISPQLRALAAIDPTLATLVHSLEVSTEQLHAPDELTRDDSRPRFFQLARPYRALMLSTAVIVILMGLGIAAPSVLFGRVADDATDGDTRTAYLWAAALALIGLGTGIAAMYSRIFAQRFNQSVIAVLRRKVFHRLTRLGVNYYDRELPGDVAARVVADLDRILSFGEQNAFRLASQIATFVAALGAIVVIAPGVAPIVLVVLSIIVVVTVGELPLVSRALEWAREELGTVTRKFQEDFGARHEIRNLGAEAIQTDKFARASWERRRARWWAATVSNVHSSLVQFLGTMMTALVLYSAGTLVLDQQLSIGAALSVQLLAALASQPLQAIAPIYNEFLNVRVSWGRLSEPFDEPIFPDDVGVSPGAVPSAGSAVTFDRVDFTYPGTTRPILRDVSFDLVPGKVTALVGYTGAGKSSIAKLLVRTYDPTAGSINVGGVDLRELPIDEFRPLLGIVPQDPFVFRGTVSSNIRYAKPDATAAEVEEAVRSVGAWPLLSGLPQRLDHRVEEEGRNLTAAQRQLIALARAWIAKPDILVLDEATSLLDSVVEDTIIDAIHDLGCTTLMITHRESVAARADYIVVLEGGSVVDYGPESDVARAGGPYDRLWRVHDGEPSTSTTMVI